MAFTSDDYPCSQICDFCGDIGHMDQSDDIFDAWHEIYRGKQQPDFFFMQFCRPCAIRMSPAVHRLRDAYELHLYVQRLERAIRERRNQNHRSASHIVGEGS